MPHETAVGAVFGVTAQGRGPARLHRGHNPALDTPEMAGMVAAESSAMRRRPHG
ncbi:hypothetical protein X743_31410 [Mesorhizobium sp. LNHC252B00]|nr:hypothetical protein X743_31410 [Mesorhizobium sp. LNHC252B00]